MDLWGVSVRVRPEDLMLLGASSSRGNEFGNGSERGGGFCVSWRRGNRTNSPQFWPACMEVGIVCPEQKKKQRQREVDEAGK